MSTKVASLWSSSLFFLATLSPCEVAAQDYGKLREAIGDTAISEDWIYEDIDAGYAEAKKSGKPLLVVFR